MEADTEDDEWEDSEEDIGEYGEEEGEYFPPGYRAADGPFKSYCTCEDFVTCSFCSWFYKIKECKRHGQATRRPFKPCTCPKEDDEKLPSLEELQKSLETMKEPQIAPARTCVCVPKQPESVLCDCLDFLKEKPPKDKEMTTYVLGHYEEYEGEKRGVSV
ncbi:hypothetical protein GE061_015246 [Apolygus lucorum]|uniref:Uncharacterized protein n=1 Tax=Apolygus lucorum TaxID=248454 RepID=A0A8S9XLJ6_APOLU|nr:hypothetical protein GE061_015246 [Apolygus lucorum]